MPKTKYERINYPHDAIVYLAAMIDGEGCLCISISRHLSQKSTHYLWPHYYSAKLEISNCDKRLMDWLTQNFGGRVDQCKGKQRMQFTNRAPAYRWTCEALKLTHLCELIYPFSVIKKEQIEIILQFRKSCERSTAYKGKQGIQPLTQEEFDFRHNLYLKLKSIHTK